MRKVSPKKPEKVPRQTPPKRSKDPANHSGKNGVQQIAKALNTNEAVKLRLAGKSYREIGEELGVTQTCAFNYIKDALRDAREETRECAEAMIQLENSRLDKIQNVHWESMLEKDPICTAHVFKAIEMRVKLNGLAAPTKIETTSPGYAIDKLNLDIETRKKILEAMEKAESV